MHHWMSTDLEDLRRNFTPFDDQLTHPHDFDVSFEPNWISLSLISIIIFTVGGNSLVCIAVLRERNLQNTTNYFLTSLALTDCLVACLVMPLAVTIELIGHFPFDALACNVWLTFDVCCCTSSIWHMSVMSLDRYLTLRYPLKYGRNKRQSLVAYKIITIWLISFAICLPLFILGLVNASNVYNERTRACFPAHRTFKIYGSFVAFFIPLFIMIVTYALTMSALQQAHTTKKNHSKHHEKIHAVLNLAAMAIRWKRAVNTVEIPDDKKTNPMLKGEHQSTINYSSMGTTQQTTTTNDEHFNPLVLIHWSKQREKRSSIQHNPPSSIHHLKPFHLNSTAKRSHSCSPLAIELDKSQSVHTLLQIRRHSAKISEELANLSARLSASVNPSRSTSARASLCVPNTLKTTADKAPTIDQLIAETDGMALAIPNLLITPSNFDEEKKSNKRWKHQRSSCTPTMETASERIQDWIALHHSSTELNENQHLPAPIRIRCSSAINFTQPVYENHFPPVTKLKRDYPRLEELSGHISAPCRPEQYLLVDDHVASARHFASKLKTNRTFPTRFSISSSITSSTRRSVANPQDRLSQVSFQTVSLDTDETSSCSSSLTHRPEGTTKNFKQSLAKHSTNNERKAMRVLLIIFSIFVILWTPFFIINLLSCFISDIHPIVISITTWLGYCSSCANPIIYTIFSRAFRRAFINILTCRKVIRRSQRSAANCRPSFHSMAMSNKCKSKSTINKEK